MGKHKCLLETERFLGLSIPEKTLPKSKNGNDEQIEIIQSLDENQIETILLERYPALLIAKAAHLTVDGEDCLLAAAPVRLDRCEGHFPGMPVLPLAVAAQAAGQACGILAKLMSRDKDCVPIAAMAGKTVARSRKFIRPGENLLIAVTPTSSRFGLYIMDVSIWVRDIRAVTLDEVGMVLPKRSEVFQESDK